MKLADVKKFIVKNEGKIVLFFGFILVSILSFQIGILQGKKWLQEPLIIEKPILASAEEEKPDLVENKPQNAYLSGDSEANLSLQEKENSSSDCKYVGSKNSDKFYLSSCPWAKRIKPENLVCFSSPNEALSLGRTESKCD